jgi:hypothetical protein
VMYTLLTGTKHPPPRPDPSAPGPGRACHRDRAAPGIHNYLTTLPLYCAWPHLTNRKYIVFNCYTVTRSLLILSIIYTYIFYLVIATHAVTSYPQAKHLKKSVTCYTNLPLYFYQTPKILKNVTATCQILTSRCNIV